MALSRPLTPREERRLVRQSRRGPARNRALITAQQFFGFRISEVLALWIGHVFRDGKIREHVALPPRFLKGHYGLTRMVPIGAEFHRALEHYFRSRARPESFRPDEPLFPSSHRLAEGLPFNTDIEENIFIWCFFLAIVRLAMDDDGTGPYKWVKNIYIDDPISSLDEHNAIVVANHLVQLFRETPNQLTP